jgi:hypothetical protein
MALVKESSSKGEFLKRMAPVKESSSKGECLKTMIPVKENSRKGGFLKTMVPVKESSSKGKCLKTMIPVKESSSKGEFLKRMVPVKESSSKGEFLKRMVSPLLELSFAGTIVFRYLCLQLFVGSNHFHLRSFGGCCNPIPLLNRKKHALNLFPDIFIYFQKKSVILE